MLTRGSAAVENSAEADALISEPLVIEPIFVSGVANAKVIGGLLYLACFVEQPGGWGDERVIKARLIIPIAALMESRAKADAALGEHGMRVISRAS